MTISFRVDATPIPQERPRFSYKGIPYYSKESQNYRAFISHTAQQTMGDRAPIDVPVAVTIDFFKNLDTSHPHFGDADNLAKAVLDAMNKIVYKDDRLVYCLIARKIQDDDEHIEVHVDF